MALLRHSWECQICICLYSVPSAILSGLSSTSASRLDLTKIGAIHFEEVDMQRFPCLALSLEAGRMGKTYPAVLAAADEAAVEHFLAGHIGFLDIARGDRRCSGWP